MTIPVSRLHEMPPGLEESAQLIADLDDCFFCGFSRLGEQNLDALRSLSATFSGTPLEERLSEAVDQFSRAQFSREAFQTMAAARAAIQGARHDAITDQLSTLFGWENAPALEHQPVEAPPEIANWLESTGQWLMEIALTGFASLDEDTVVPFDSTLRELHERPQALRIASLLTGFREELLANAPTASMEKVPSTRWADLWSRAMLHTLTLPPSYTAEPVSGVLRIIGVDLRHHSNMASFVAYGLLDDGDKTRFVRTTFSSYKVDIIIGEEIWGVFSESASPLLKAIGSEKELAVTDMPLLPTGDLLWNGQAKVGKKFNMLKESEKFFGPDADESATMPALDPLDRHPVQLAVPIYLDDYEIEFGAEADTGAVPQISLGDGSQIELDVQRISPHSELELDHIMGSKKMFGLLRMDAGTWRLQPLVETKRSKLAFTGSSANSSKSNATVSTLRERAGKLLRK